MNGPDLVDALRSPRAYPVPVDYVGCLETHISRLFFAGHRVYKLKKPLRLPFLDYSTLEKRHDCCQEEVRLGRRLARSVYRGVVPIIRTDRGRLRVGTGVGDIVDWAVEMTRLPDEGMLDQLLERGEVDNALMDQLVDLLARFHADAPTGEDVDEHGSVEAVTANVLDNISEIEPFVVGGTGLDALSPALHAFLREHMESELARHGELMRQRVSEGRIRDGHGDLHAGNICRMAGGPGSLSDLGELVVYDPIEFSRRLRCADVACDLAFLAMDLDLSGYRGFSRYLVRRYAEATSDPGLKALIPFYSADRALVRGKVACLAAERLPLGSRERRDRRRAAMRNFHLAATYGLPSVLVLTCGLPASGKSWAARAVADPFEARILRSDVVRKAQAGLPPTASAASDFGTGLYAPEVTDQVYHSLLAQALARLEQGHSVVVDATFSHRMQRQPFLDAAARLGHPVVLLHARCPEELTRQRLTRRAHDPDEVSDADLEVWRQAREDFEAPKEVNAALKVQVEPGDTPEDLASRVLDQLVAQLGPSVHDHAQHVVVHEPRAES